MSLPLTKTTLSFCLGKGRLSIRGSKRRPWLEITRSELEGRYLSYQLFSLRRNAGGPFDDVRNTLAGRGFYDSERIKFTAEGIEQAYALLYPRDQRLITQKVLDLVGVPGLAALWLDQGKINSSKRGSLRGKYSLDELNLLKKAFKSHGIACGYSPLIGGSLLFNQEAMKALKALLAPHTHYSMRTKLMLRRPRSSRGSKPAAHQPEQLLRQC